jgi:hypothetical protein
LARELVRNIQDARKSNGFAIADRISIYLDGVAGGTLAAALHTWGEYVRAETLADELVLGAAPSGVKAEALDLDTGNVLLLAVVQRA